MPAAGAAPVVPALVAALVVPMAAATLRAAPPGRIESGTRTRSALLGTTTNSPVTVRSLVTRRVSSSTVPVTPVV